MTEKNKMYRLKNISIKDKIPKLSKKKKIALSAILIIILLAAGGLFAYMKYQEHNRGLIVEQAMKSKYGKHFDILGFAPIDEESFVAYLGVGEIEGAVVKTLISSSGTDIKDNYVSVRLCHETTEEAIERLQPDEALFIHTDNLLEYTDSGSKDAETVTRAEYLNEHPSDRIDITVLVNSSLVDPASLRNALGTAAYGLSVERGEFNVYAADNDSFEAIKDEITHYDSIRSEKVKEALDAAGGSILTLSFEEINPPAKKTKEKSDAKS